MEHIDHQTVMDETASSRGVVEDACNGDALERELAWFSSVLDVRLRLHFGDECSRRDPFDIPPPELDERSWYAAFVRHYELNSRERLLFMVALLPSIRPQLLDPLSVRNTALDRPYPEFGGRSGGAAHFLPTVQTVLFLLAGNDLSQQFRCRSLLTSDHVFRRHHILTVTPAERTEPAEWAVLGLSPEIIDLVTSGSCPAPAFGQDFPAALIETGLYWKELVLEPSTREQVLEIRAWMDYGSILLNDLGLGRKLKPGYRALFYGSPGTGKTVTAALLGKETGRDVYRIDLSLVVSKYIGETEKNLEKIFSKATHRDWILFFDEADALFGKRTAVQDAHDRFANQEVSYLLQRIEDHPGVVILATNQRTNIDDAFLRRFQSIVHFPLPGVEERQALWQQAFPEQLQLEDGSSAAELARRYELSGGSIMNVVRFAALSAVRTGRKRISLSDIEEGIRRELHKEGRTA